MPPPDGSPALPETEGIPLPDEGRPAAASRPDGDGIDGTEDTRPESAEGSPAEVDEELDADGNPDDEDVEGMEGRPDEDEELDGIDGIPAEEDDEEDADGIEAELDEDEDDELEDGVDGMELLDCCWLEDSQPISISAAAPVTNNALTVEILLAFILISPCLASWRGVHYAPEIGLFQRAAGPHPSGPEFGRIPWLEWSDFFVTGVSRYLPA